MSKGLCLNTSFAIRELMKWILNKNIFVLGGENVAFVEELWEKIDLIKITSVRYINYLSKLRLQFGLCIPVSGSLYCK